MDCVTPMRGVFETESAVVGASGGKPESREVSGRSLYSESA